MNELNLNKEKINEKEIKIAEIKSYLESLSSELRKILKGTRSEMEEIIKKAEEEKVKKALEDLRSM